MSQAQTPTKDTDVAVLQERVKALEEENNALKQVVDIHDKEKEAESFHCLRCGYYEAGKLNAFAFASVTRKVIHCAHCEYRYSTGENRTRWERKRETGEMPPITLLGGFMSRSFNV